MRHPLCTLLLAIALVACAPGLRAQEYGAVVVFGDSLSDSGNVAQGLGLAAGLSFTTNPDPVWAEIVADELGAPGTNSLAGGSNFAFGGACVNPANACTAPVPGIGLQITQHLGTRPAGEADPDALYALWAGSNDVVAILEAAPMPSPGEPPANLSAAVAATVESHVGEIRRLQAAGARHIVVLNLADAGATPYARRVPVPGVPATLTELSRGYNEALNSGLASLDEGIVPINAFGLIDRVVRDPVTYGFINVYGTACAPAGPDVTLLTCAPAGSGSPVTYAPGANNTHLFADGKHPTGATHALLARLVTATLAAPVQVSLAGEAGEAAVAAHRSVVAAERRADLEREHAAGHWSSYVVAHSGRREVDALPRLGEAEADEQAVTVGLGQRMGRDVWWGVALSLGRHVNGVSGATLDGGTAVGSLHGTWRQGGLYASGAVNLGRTQLDIERFIALGQAMSIERGATAGRQVGADVGLGWTMGGTDGFRHGPVLGLSWLDQTVDGYREDGDSPAAMHFSAFERGSLVARAGYGLAFEAGTQSLGIRPYAAVAYAKELGDDPVSVTAGSNTMAGRFTAEGFTPPRYWLSVDLGASASLGGQASAALGYSGRIGDGARSDHLVNVGLRIVF